MPGDDGASSSSEEEQEWAGRSNKAMSNRGVSAASSSEEEQEWAARSNKAMSNRDLPAAASSSEEEQEWAGRSNKAMSNRGTTKPTREGALRAMDKVGLRRQAERAVSPEYPGFDEARGCRLFDDMRAAEGSADWKGEWVRLIVAADRAGDSKGTPRRRRSARRFPRGPFFITAITNSVPGKVKVDKVLGIGCSHESDTYHGAQPSDDRPTRALPAPKKEEEPEQEEEKQVSSSEEEQEVAGRSNKAMSNRGRLSVSSSEEGQ
jgi:hypothetical protein